MAIYEFYYGAVVIMKEIGPEQDPFMTLQIQVENVVCWLKPCSMCPLRTELDFGNYMQLFLSCSYRFGNYSLI